jgi:biopolymer transport protein ExbD
MSDQPTELDLLFRESPAGDESEELPEGEAKRKRRRRSSVKDKQIRELNLTAMMDMMTIILVFLLKNYATTPENVQMGPDLTPPRSTAKIPMEVAVTITITKKAILVDDKPIVQLENFGVRGEDPNKANAQAIDDLSKDLDDKVSTMERIAAMGGPGFEGKILIVCDGKVPYALLMRVLYTAGLAHFSEYKLVVRSEIDNQVMHTATP